MQGPAPNFEAPYQGAENRTQSEFPFYYAARWKLWQQHGEQRRRVEVLRSVQEPHVQQPEKTVEPYPDLASWTSTVVHSCRCLL